ncbi:purine-nucleoside phosphorylase [soil metagenome]
MTNTWLATAEWLRERGIVNPQIGIVLGTGLHQLTEKIDVEIEISYTEIPGFPFSTIESHRGKLLYGKLHGKSVLAMAGRVHFYEGYSMNEVVFPVRTMYALGIQTLILSNASGCIHPMWKKGEIMLIKDHINLQPQQADAISDVTFVNRKNIKHYDVNYQTLLLEIAQSQQLILREGTYASVPGPLLETRAEYRYLRTIGADAVGMSTVPEVIAANELGMKTVAVSVLTDECDPDNLKSVTLAEIIEIANSADYHLTRLIAAFIQQL